MRSSVARPLAYKSIHTSKDYEKLLKASYIGVKKEIQEIALPAVQAIVVSGNEPPASAQYQDAIAVLYGTAYTLKMGLKFGKIRKPKGYFDFKVGALESLWWSTGETFEINNPNTLQWKACLMVPAFVSKALVEEARRQASAKHPEVLYERASLETIDEGRAVQVLHVGPYDAEQPTIERLHHYIAEHGLSVAGRHHEIYISDPRRTKPEKLRTVIRLPVASAA
jgi:hypothetical protein